jgi:serine/threonine-protein kinase
MSTQIGRFEILSEIAKSARGGVFKANDPTSNQTVALKTVCLDIPEDQAKEFVERVLAEGEHTRELNSQNLALLYGAGQIEDQFCAAMEYVQGNSIATMLARHEGFSIWDLLDISRQVCAGLDHAGSIGVVHHSLEPAKIMVQWDGLVKILGYGISTMSLLDTEPEGVPSPVLHYMSPEQVGGGATDGRSNLFTWGAILYEMVTDQPAFDGTTTDVVFHNILNENPVPPSQINNKIHPAVSELVMKALAKNPDERYQSGREMLDDLEKCKESTGKSATKKSEPARAANVPAGARTAAASKFAGAPAPKPAAAPRAVAAPKPAPPAPAPVSKVFDVAPPAAETENDAVETADFEPSIAAEQISSAGTRRARYVLG